MSTYKILSLIEHSTNYWVTDRLLVAELGNFELADFLCYLLNYHQRVSHSKSYRWDSGWFYCPADTIQREIFFPRKKQTRLLQLLQEGHWIQFRKRDTTGRRFIRINQKKILGIITKVKSPEVDLSKSPKTDLSKSPKTDLSKSPEVDLSKSPEVDLSKSPEVDLCNKKNRVIRNRGPRSLRERGGTLRVPTRKKKLSQSDKYPIKTNGQQSTKRKAGGIHPIKDQQLLEWENKCGKKLRTFLAARNDPLIYPPLSKNGKKRRSSLTVKRLAEGFAHLRYKLKIPSARIERSLDWLIEHYDEPYVPKIYHADDFAEKYQKIEDCISRAGADGETHKGRFCEGSPELQELRSKYYNRFGFRRALQEELDEILVETGEEPGSVKAWML
ncbi:MAG: hypothetical protein ACXQTR_01040 [Candidatus Methanospirareceae archaeon]